MTFEIYTIIMCKKKKKKKNFVFFCFDSNVTTSLDQIPIEKKKRKRFVINTIFFHDRLDIDLKERKEEEEGKRRKKREVECRIRYS